MAGRSDPTRPTQSRLGDLRSEILHASCVAQDGKAVLILGASGTGKSGLALQLMALGADLVADDRTILTPDGDTLWASAPDHLNGLIEAREVGILRVPAAGRQHVALVVDLNEVETDRLPQWHTRVISGIPIPLLRKSDAPHFPAAIKTYLRGQREA